MISLSSDAAQTFDTCYFIKSGTAVFNLTGANHSILNCEFDDNNWDNDANAGIITFDATAVDCSIINCKFNGSQQYAVKIDADVAGIKFIGNTFGDILDNTVSFKMGVSDTIYIDLLLKNNVSTDSTFEENLGTGIGDSRIKYQTYQGTANNDYTVNGNGTFYHDTAVYRTAGNHSLRVEPTSDIKWLFKINQTANTPVSINYQFKTLNFDSADTITTNLYLDGNEPELGLPDLTDVQTGDFADWTAVQLALINPETTDKFAYCEIIVDSSEASAKAWFTDFYNAEFTGSPVVALTLFEAGMPVSPMTATSISEQSIINGLWNADDSVYRLSGSKGERLSQALSFAQFRETKNNLPT